MIPYCPILSNKYGVNVGAALTHIRIHKTCGYEYYFSIQDNEDVYCMSIRI